MAEKTDTVASRNIIPAADSVSSHQRVFEDHLRQCYTCRPSVPEGLFIACAVGAVLLGRYVVEAKARAFRKPFTRSR